MALLDTTFLIDLMKEAKKRRSGSATVKLDELIGRGEALRIAVFTIGELYVGVAKGTQPTRERIKVEMALQPFEVVPFEDNTARIFGGVVGELEKRGRPISDMDALIASVALESDELLITRNFRHFQQVPGLRVETY
jgi:predicted nucleic acid-binding protein